MPCYQQAVSRVVPTIQPSLEHRIRALRHFYPMVDSLDQRIKRQRELVARILEKRGLTITYLMDLQKAELPDDDEIILCYNILMDCDYIDSLR